MFKIMDLLTGELVCVCKTKSEVLLARDQRNRSLERIFTRVKWWPSFSIEFIFTELNVTGKDIHPCALNRLFYVDGSYVRRQVSNEPPALRRFQVLDDFGKSVDIREWTAEMHDILAASSRQPRHHFQSTDDPAFRRDPIEGTDRVRRRRITGYAMWHSTAAQNEGVPYIDMDDDEVYTPIIDHGKARKRPTALSSQWCQYEEKLNGRDRLRKSWKDNSKGLRQWSKNAHMTRAMRQEARDMKACAEYFGTEESFAPSDPLLEELYDLLYGGDNVPVDIVSTIGTEEVSPLGFMQGPTMGANLACVTKEE